MRDRPIGFYARQCTVNTPTREHSREFYLECAKSTKNKRRVSAHTRYEQITGGNLRKITVTVSNLRRITIGNLLRITVWNLCRITVGNPRRITVGNLCRKTLNRTNLDSGTRNNPREYLLLGTLSTLKLCGTKCHRWES
jgi:hypothetical protein